MTIRQVDVVRIQIGTRIAAMLNGTQVEIGNGLVKYVEPGVFSPQFEVAMIFSGEMVTIGTVSVQCV